MPFPLRCIFWFGFSLLLLTWMWVASLHRYDEVALQRAKQEMYRLQQPMPFHWTFDGPSDFAASRKRHGLTKLRFHTGQLQAVSVNADPYFYLALQGYTIDAKRYSVLTIRIFSEVATCMELFFQIRKQDPFTFASPLISLAKGWQTLTIDLHKLNWSQIGSISEKQEVTEPPLWGGKEQVVSTLRIDPVTDANIVFKIDRIWLLGTPLPSFPTTNAALHYLRWDQASPTRPVVPLIKSGIIRSEKRAARPVISRLTFDESILIEYANSRWTALEQWPVRSISLAPGQWRNTLAQLQKRRNEFLLLEDTTQIRTPESALWFRDQIKLIAPSAIVFPRPLTPIDLITPSLPTAVKPPTTIGYGLGVFLALLTMFFWWERKRWWTLADRLRATLESLLLVVLSLGLWWLLPNLRNQTWLPLLLAGLFLLLCLLLNGNRPFSWKQAIIGKPGAWLATLQVTLPLFLLLLALSWLGQGFHNLTLGGLLLYLVWALAQQYLVGSVFALRLRKIWGPEPAILAAACLFGWLHYPNFALMAITFVMGLFWVYLYLRYHSLLPLAISHSVLASLFLGLAPNLISGEVGNSYFSRVWGE